ncbi:hypothetical protein IFM89_001087 [Coptis chinensis]|uniref:DUF8039 domain-containing protein n=1 Tax=Coptis chinensis TaxID=261450 RepID=A0A835LU44_9MAGN|nr:hypothetical protein IFM89_001087 [Coptis chinensis]
MDTHYSPGGSNSLDDDQLNEDMGDDATNIPSSSVAASSKKRGPSIGIEEIEGQPRPKLVMQTNRKGQPVTPIDVVSEFGTRLGYISRRDFPVCYEDWRHIAKDLKDKVVKTLGRQFVFEYEKTIDTDYTRQKLNEAWRNYKHTLYETFVKDEDPSLVKEVASRNIPLEDWFVDYCNTDKFKAMSARNKLNREQQIMPSSLGRTSVAIARNELALEKGIPESEITRADSYMLIHKPKETVPQSQEVLNSIKNHISEHPESQYDLSGDAIATVVGPDKRGRFRGLGTGVCKIVLRKGDSLMKKNDGLMEANTLLERRIETMEANMDAKMSRHMEEVRGLFMSQRGTFNDNVPSPHSHASRHSTAPLENAYYIGKDCELRGGWPLELVARGVVQDVDPNTEYGERTLEEGNFKVYVQVVHRADAILPFPHNAWQKTLGQVVQGAVIWPKEFLVFASHSSSS